MRGVFACGSDKLKHWSRPLTLVVMGNALRLDNVDDMETESPEGF